MKKLLFVLSLFIYLNSFAQHDSNKLHWRGLYLGTTTYAIYNFKYPALFSATLSSPFTYKRFGIGTSVIVPIHRQTIPVLSLAVNYKIIGK